MNREEAKQVLLLYRPGTEDAEDPQVKAAMELVAQEPELRHWFTEHSKFQIAMRSRFRELDVPGHLKAALLARTKIEAPPDS